MAKRQPKTARATELNTHSGKLLKAVIDDGVEFIVERYGRPVARIVPVQDVLPMEAKNDDPVS